MLRVDTLQDYITCAICTNTRFACEIHKTHCKTCKQRRAEPHILSHFASRAGERANRWAVQTEPIFPFPFGRGCVTRDLLLQSFGAMSLFRWMQNIWSIWGCRPRAIKEWPIHLTAALTASTRCSSWSHYLTYWCVFLHFCSGKTRRLASRLSDERNYGLLGKTVHVITPGGLWKWADV